MSKLLHQLLVTSFALTVSYFSHSQFGYEYDTTLHIIKSGTQLKNAWGGGFNQIQISDFDFDFDGDLDLFIFDRSSNNIRVLKQENNASGPYYCNVYNAGFFFPNDILYRATMVDYDGDGKADLFTYGLSGLKVYRNVGNASIGLQWELMSELLYASDQGNSIQIFINASDIPAITDVDFDGDIDILTFEQGGTHLQYFQNQSIELYGHADSLTYELKNYCWGLFTEDFNTNVLVLNDPNAPCGTGNVPNPEKTSVDNLKKHAGSTILAIDYDNSGVMDLILGDVSYNSLTLALNGGSAPNTNSALVSQDANFPSNTTPVDISIFPAAFYVDVDFDNVKDIVVCPNAKNISENEKSIWFYKNNGTNQNPILSFSKQNLFQSDMIEHGSGTIPTLFDYDEDGLVDLVIANFYRYKDPLDKESSMALYLNTGTQNNPEYTFIDNDYLNLSQQNLGLRLAPTFGDIDGDGDNDLFFGSDDGTISSSTNSSTGSGAIFSSITQNLTDNQGTIIDVGSFSYPQLFDLNKDNLLDLLIGNKNGFITYYENTGTVSSPEFTLITSTLGQIDLSNGTFNAFMAPNFYRSNDTTYLAVGTFDGIIYQYDNIDNNIQGAFNLVTDNLAYINVEAYAAPFIADLDNDGQLNMLLGQDLGGLYHFEVNPNSTLDVGQNGEVDKFNLFPNPTRGQITITANHTIQQIQVVELSGRLIKTLSANSNEIRLDLSDLTKGVYFINIIGNSIQTQKVILN